MTIKKTVSAFLMASMIAALCFNLPITVNAADVLVGDQQLALENEWLSLYVTPSSGDIKIVNKTSGAFWLSNPENAKEDKIAKNIFKTNLRSQLLVEYLEESRLRETNSCVGSVGEKNLTVQKADGKLLLNYCFPEQGFNIPVFYSLKENRLSVSIDYKNIKEKGRCSLTKIGLLPYFAAGGQSDKGYMLVPDGSGAIINFNNNKYSQGSFKTNVYGKDITETSEKSTVESKACLLPMFGTTHYKKGSVLTVATDGEAGAELISTVAGKETGYNHAFFRFTFRYYNSTTLLDRTWASKEIIMPSKSQLSWDKAEVEYSFLQNEDIVGFANEYRKYLTKAGLREKEVKKNTLFLDVYSGVKVKKQFLGFTYAAIQPLTTFEQLKIMTSELNTLGVENIKVRLNGADSSGAYYGKIDDKIQFSSAVGGMGGYKSLEGLDFLSLYPNVDITEFTDNSLQYNSFFHSVVNVVNKTAKLYDYKFSTKLRDYDTPVRYLLKPEKVAKAAAKLQNSISRQNIKGVAFESLANSLYSCYSGNVYEINKTKELFGKLIKQTALSADLMLCAPNAYAMPFANSIMSLPTSCSGHYTEDYSVPFIQMVLDGFVEYSVEPINLFGNKDSAFLAAVESNSSLNFISMYENFDKVSNTDLKGMYSATFDFWKKDISDMYSELSKIREITENSAISNYNIISENIREISFKNGTKIYINRADALCVYKDISIPANNLYILEANK